MIPTFEEQQEAWSNPPLDDIGYVSSDYLLSVSQSEFARLIRRSIFNRYGAGGWRNYQGLWRKSLKLDNTFGRKILDYGCGAGFEALQYAKKNRVWLADISSKNLAVAERTLGTMNFTPEGLLLISEDPPFCNPPETLNVIHCSGVLHHIPKPKPVVEAMAGWLSSEGELRLMVYTDRAWEKCTETKPPKEVTRSKNFEKFVTCMDGVGGYADWYNAERIQERFGRWFTLESTQALTPDGVYMSAILKKR